MFIDTFKFYKILISITTQKSLVEILYLQKKIVCYDIFVNKRHNRLNINPLRYFERYTFMLLLTISEFSIEIMIFDYAVRHSKLALNV